jgi:hypothetical protein
VEGKDDKELPLKIVDHLLDDCPLGLELLQLLPPSLLTQVVNDFLFPLPLRLRPRWLGLLHLLCRPGGLARQFPALRC